jgi:CheY-like chemotaxis protein
MTSASQTPALSILLAEDEAMLRMLAADTLRDSGYEVIETVDGAAALEVLKSGVRVDLLISDIKMPRMTGYELVEAGLSLRPQLRVLLMTGYSQEPVPTVISSTNIPVLHKPFDFDELPKYAEKIINSHV